MSDSPNNQITVKDAIQKTKESYRVRTVLFCILGAGGNALFAIYNGFSGWHLHSIWNASVAAYYLILAEMRIHVLLDVRHAIAVKDPAERRIFELRTQRRISRVLLILGIVFGGMVLLMLLNREGKHHSGIGIYALALYTFYRIIMSRVNLLRVRKEHSPLLTMIRRINYIDACVAMFTLQTAMFTKFGGGGLDRQKMNAVLGCLVFAIITWFGARGMRESRKGMEIGRQV